MTRLARIFAVLAAPMLLLTPLFAGTVAAAGAPSGPGNQHFNRTWQRTDLPVADLIVDRTWIWGPDGQVTNLNWKVAACDANLNCSWGIGYQSIVVDRS
ncbi:hypothetical protein BH23CHL2_BH23CHL2_32020 [soil metagenome]